MRLEDEEMEALWSHLREVYATSHVRQFVLYDDVDVLDGWGLPVKSGKVLLPDGPFGWSQGHVDIVVNGPVYQRPEDIVSMAPSGREFDAMVSFPGGYTYGHWLVDIVPRIEFLLQNFARQRLALILPGPLPAWTEPFLAPYDFAPDDLIQVVHGSRYRSAHFMLPSLGRNSDYLPPDPHLRAFTTLRNHWLRPPVEGAARSRLLVGHTPQTSSGLRSTVGNFNELRQRLETEGFTTIFPAELTHEQQVAAFAAAEIIVGEDSSALHNIVYSTDARLVVINSAARKNLLHLSIAKLLGHRCRYMFCAEQPAGGFVCDVGEVLRLIAGP